MDDHKKSPGTSPVRRIIFGLVPVVVFGGMALLFAIGLKGDPGKLPSVLIGKPVPQFDLPALNGALYKGAKVPGLKTGDLKKGRLTLVNVWASWCIPCRQEHPQLMAIARAGKIDLVGINHKDTRANALAFLREGGSPYSAIGVDTTGRASIDWGVYGVPETYLVDAKGVIRYKFVGPITPKALKGTLQQHIDQARKSAD